MVDVAKAAGMKIDVPALAERLDCSVAPVVAVENMGVDELKRIVAKAVEAPPVPAAEIVYDNRSYALTAARNCGGRRSLLAINV